MYRCSDADGCIKQAFVSRGSYWRVSDICHGFLFTWDTETYFKYKHLHLLTIYVLGFDIEGPVNRFI